MAGGRVRGIAHHRTSGRDPRASRSAWRSCTPSVCRPVCTAAMKSSVSFSTSWTCLHTRTSTGCVMCVCRLTSSYAAMGAASSSCHALSVRGTPACPAGEAAPIATTTRWASSSRGWRVRSSSPPSTAACAICCRHWPARTAASMWPGTNMWPQDARPTRARASTGLG